MDRPYQRKFEELQRCLSRIEKLYDWKIINEEWECTFSTPKDLFLNFFRVSYELKENTKLETWFWWYNWKIEIFCNSNNLIWLSLDIANLKKHWKLDKNKTNHIIWEINVWIHVFDPDWKDRTEIQIKVDWNCEDWLKLCENIFEEWKKFLLNNKLI